MEVTNMGVHQKYSQQKRTGARLPSMRKAFRFLEEAKSEFRKIQWTEGEEVVVRGRVENLVILAGQNYGLTLKEIERKPAGMKWPWRR